RRYSLRRDWHWLQGDMGKGFAQSLSGGKRASRRLLSELVNGTWNDGAGAVRPARIYHKQIACAVKGQTLCAARHRTKSRSRIPMENSRRIVSVDVPAQIRHKEIAHAVEGQAGWAIGGIQRGKGSARSVRFVCIDATLIDVTDAVIRHEQVPRAVESHASRVVQPRGKGGSQPVRFVFIDDAAVVIRYKQITCLVHDQVGRVTQPGRKDG